MAIVAIGSAHGAPGVTTLAVALAHRLPLLTGRDAMVVEADADGGTIAARHHLTGPPSFSALAGTARQGIEPARILDSATAFASGVAVLTAHPAAEQAHAALRAGAAAIAPACAGLDLDVVVDLGRLRAGSPARPFATSADCLVVVARPVVEQLVAVADRLASWQEMAPVHLVLVGTDPYPPSEVRRVLGVDEVTVIADDAKAVRCDPGAAKRRSSWRSGVDTLAAIVTRQIEATGRVDPDGAFAGSTALAVGGA